MRVEFHVLRRSLILSIAEAPEEPVQGGEYHASPSVGLQSPLVVLVVSLPEESGVEEGEEAGGELTELAITIAGAGGVEDTAGGVMTAAAVVIGAAGA